jgi:hypothetical protein
LLPPNGLLAAPEKENEPVAAAKGFEPNTEAPPKELEAKGAAEEDDVGIANRFALALNVVAEKGFEGRAGAAVEGDAAGAGAGAGAGEV